MFHAIFITMCKYYTYILYLYSVFLFPKSGNSIGHGVSALIWRKESDGETERRPEANSPISTKMKI